MAGIAAALQAEDVFQASSGWQHQLVPVAIATLRRDFDLRDGLWKSAELQKGVAAGLSSPTSWIVARDGLHIRYGQYEVAPYVYGMPEIVLPWSELKPYLNPALETAKLPLCKAN